MSNIQCPKAMTAVATFKMQGKVVLRRIGADRLLVPVSGGVAGENCVFPVNETGEFIWDRLTRGRSVPETAAALAEEFAVAPAAALADCREFAARLVGQGLLEAAE